MTTTRAQRIALDELDDAREFKQRYDRGNKILTTTLLVSILSVLLGAFLEAGGLTIALTVLGGVGAVASVGFGIWWYWWNHTGYVEWSIYRKPVDSPAQKLREAEREYRESTYVE